MKYLKFIVITVCIWLAIITICMAGIIVYSIYMSNNENLLKTNEDVLINLSGRYPGDEFEILDKKKIDVFTQDYDGKTIKKKGNSYRVKSKLTNVEFDISDGLYYGCTGHVVDRAIFCINDNYKENWCMKVADDVGCDDKIIGVHSTTIEFDITKFSSYEEFCEEIYEYKCKITEGDLYRIIKKKNSYECIVFTIKYFDKHTDIYTDKINSKNDLATKYAYLEKFIEN